MRDFRIDLDRENLTEVLSGLVTLGASDEESALEQFAQIAWSCIVEPGDQSANLVIGNLGALGALGVVASGKDSAEIFASNPDLRNELNEIFVDGEKTLADALERWRPRLNIPEICDLAKRHKAMSGVILTRDSPSWPVGLEDLGHSSPMALWCHGDTRVLDETSGSVAVVGSRIATEYGQLVTADLVAELVSANVATLSGGAFGIDAAAHRAALAMDGVTIAILAGGSDRFYPSGNRELFEKIQKRGLVVTEMPPGAMPTKWRFLQRNRLVAALSSATVVVEAGWRSGSMNTANHAEQISRPVFAFPGPVTSPSSAGCHRLIREGKASLVASGRDVLEDLGWVSPAIGGNESSLSPNEQRAIDALSRNPRPFAALCRDSGLTPQEAQTALGSLILQGLAKEVSGGWSL